MSSKNFTEINSDFTFPNLTYLDNASRTFKPNTVIDSMSNSNSVEDHELVRSKVKKLLNARRDNEIVFTSGTTHGINLVAQGLCKNWHSTDCVIVPESEHEANLLIWQTMAEYYGFRFETVNVIKDGSLDLGHLEELLEECQGNILYSTSHISNTIGFIQPIKDIFAKIKEYNGLVMLDASLSISRTIIDVQELDIDFLVFSANKFYGPTGVGVLYGKYKYLEKLDKPPLAKLHPNTPNIDGVVAMGKAIDWFSEYDLEDLEVHNKLMNANFQMMLNDLDFVEVFHPGYYKGGLISFNVKNAYPADVVSFFASKNIVIAGGYLNAQPIVEEKFTNGVVRVSWAYYNTKDDIELVRQTLVDFYSKYAK